MDKMKPEQLKIGDTLAFHSEPVDEFGKIVCYGIQNLTISPFNHIATYTGEGFVYGAISEGYKKQTLQEACVKGIDTVSVYRYHADRDELTTEQQRGIVAWCKEHENSPYDYLDILALAGIMELNDTTWASEAFRTFLSIQLKIADAVIMSYIKTYQFFAELLLGGAVNTNNGMLICSRAGYQALTVGAGVKVNVLNADARENFYKLNGNIMSRFKQVNLKELIQPDDPAFVTPRDLAMSPDLTLLDTLEI